MTDTLMGVSPPPDPAQAGDAEDRELSPADLAAAEDLVRRARQAGTALTGPDCLLNAMTKTVVEAALEEEMADHLGYDKHAVEGRDRANSRNGRRYSPTVAVRWGPTSPRDRDGSFEPQLVKKRQRRLGEVDEVVLSLYAKGLTTGEISAHFADVYGASVSKDTVSRITDRVIEEMQDLVGERLSASLRWGLSRGWLVLTPASTSGPPAERLGSSAGVVRPKFA